MDKSQEIISGFDHLYMEFAWGKTVFKKTAVLRRLVQDVMKKACLFYIGDPLISIVLECGLLRPGTYTVHFLIDIFCFLCDGYLMGPSYTYFLLHLVTIDFIGRYSLELREVALGDCGIGYLWFLRKCGIT